MLALRRSAPTHALRSCHAPTHALRSCHAPTHALRALLLSTVAAIAATLAPAPAHAAEAVNSTTAATARSTAAYGGKVYVTVKVTGPAGEAVNGTVNLMRKLSSNAEWSFAARLTTRSGQAVHSYSATHTYLWQARFVGNSAYARSTSPTRVVTVTQSSLGQKAVQEAARHAGKPYQYGASGPSRFDCSGYTRYVFGRFGKSLPHNSGQQYGSVRHVAKSSMRVGDLIFFTSSGRISHVGIYAGNGYMWHSPHSGEVVKRARIYSSSYVVGRVG